MQKLRGDVNEEYISKVNQRFFLSEEGIGVHFGVYEIGSYAEGEQDIIVPYEAFDRGSAD